MRIESEVGSPSFAWIPTDGVTVLVVGSAFASVLSEADALSILEGLARLGFEEHLGC